MIVLRTNFFKESVKIDPEENLDAFLSKSAKTMEFVIRECRSEYEIFSMAKKFMTDK